MRPAEHILRRLRKIAYEAINTQKVAHTYVRETLAAELCATGYVTQNETFGTEKYTLVRFTMSREQAVAFLLAYPEDTP